MVQARRVAGWRAEPDLQSSNRGAKFSTTKAAIRLLAGLPMRCSSVKQVSCDIADGAALICVRRILLAQLPTGLDVKLHTTELPICACRPLIWLTCPTEQPTATHCRKPALPVTRARWSKTWKQFTAMSAQFAPGGCSSRRAQWNKDGTN